MAEEPISRIELAGILIEITGSMLSLAIANEAGINGDHATKTARMDEFYDRLGKIYAHYDVLVGKAR